MSQTDPPRTQAETRIEEVGVESGSRQRACAAFAVIAVLSGVWAVAVLFTGGFDFDSSLIRLSSRRPRNPTIIAIISGVMTGLLATPAQRRQFLINMQGRLARAVARGLRVVNAVPPAVAPVAAAAVAIAVVSLALLKGTHVAGGSDSYGYASQADLWVRGTLRVEQPLMDELKWPLARSALAPLGYRPAVKGPAIVPVYAPGLPMVMAVFARVAGRPAVFYVVPLLGGLAIWMTYLMGSRLAGRAVGLSSVILLASSPVFLYQVLQPISDVPAMAWWSATLAALLFEFPAAAFVAGVSAGAAILTRANLAPLLAIPCGLLVWRAAIDRSSTAGRRRRAMTFAAGAFPGCAAAAVLNAHWYGSPLSNGYGSFGDLYQWGNVWPNLARYPRWLIESQTPIVLLACAAPFLLPRAAGPHTVTRNPRAIAVAWLAFIVAVFACYALYAAFDAWWYLRFLLPAFPAMSVLTAVGIVSASTRWAGRARLLMVATVIAVVAWHGGRYAIEHDTFNMRAGERKYVAVGRYIAERLPERGVFLAIQHSGSVRYYSGRLTVRYDFIDPQSLDSAIEDLRHHGYQPYFVLEDDEEQQFRARFGGYSALGTLDWPPLARLHRTPGVSIYDPSQKPMARSRPAIDVIDDSGAEP